jgi:predicted RNA binding protein YcfA (HicA-like mRNA interferase family)
VPSPVRFAQVVKMLRDKGYYPRHVRGSHHRFENSKGQVVVVPVHHNLVKAVYVKQIEKL